MGSSDRARYGSDVVVDFLIERGVRYIALNPGASYRGLHDSLVNTPGAPELILCPHEKQAVNVAHGYAKASGTVGVAAVHDIVGLLHGSLGIFTAFHDRAPLLVLGGAGPMDATSRRPWIEWLHTANVQGTAVRDFTKFDDQPTSIEAIPNSLVRAWRVAQTEPAGPVYVALDADLQEKEIDADVPHFDPARVAPATPIGADADALEEAIRLLVSAARPLIIAGHAGRDPRAFASIPELGEMLGAGLIDTTHRLSLPNRHPLNAAGTRAIEEADVILLLDVKNPDLQLARDHGHERGIRLRVAPGVKIIDIGFLDLHVTSWVQDFGAIIEADLRILADTRSVLPALVEGVRQRIAEDSPEATARRAIRRTGIEAAHEARFAEWEVEAAGRGHERPVATAWLAHETWAAIKDTDWVLAAGTASKWAPRLWDFDRPYRHAGLRVDAANQISTAIGVGLAHKGSGRLVVDIQPDGDLMYDLGALWIASAHSIPLLVVMFNNHAYYNDFGHQAKVAEMRGSDPARVPVGITLEPSPDYARVAQGLGWHAEGPITDPAELRSVIGRAADVVLSEGRPALVDVVCQPR